MNATAPAIDIYDGDRLFSYVFEYKIGTDSGAFRYFAEIVCRFVELEYAGIGMNHRCGYGRGLLRKGGNAHEE